MSPLNTILNGKTQVHTETFHVCKWEKSSHILKADVGAAVGYLITKRRKKMTLFWLNVHNSFMV